MICDSAFEGPQLAGLLIGKESICFCGKVLEYSLLEVPFCSDTYRSVVDGLHGSVQYILFAATMLCNELNG